MHRFSDIIAKILPLAEQAGALIMDVYGDMVNARENNLGFIADIKGDGSPVTQADQKADAVIVDGLGRLIPDIPIISEENYASHMITAPERFFLVDPLDGTREFIKADGLGSFTVNIALVEKGEVVLGLVYAPALKRMFYGARGLGGFENGHPIKAHQDGEKQAQEGEKKEAKILLSLSHADQHTRDWVKNYGPCQEIAIGSSLKFALLATGEADIYPRFNPTMEWDTAAGQAVLEAAGGVMRDFAGQPFRYGKENYRNGPFLACSALIAPSCLSRLMEI